MGAPSGERHGRSKLTAYFVRQIRERHLAYVVSYEKLAKDYEVSPVTIRDVVKFKTWRHVR